MPFLTLKKTGIKEAIAIFWIISDPSGLQGLKHSREKGERRQGA